MLVFRATTDREMKLITTARMTLIEKFVKPHNLFPFSSRRMLRAAFAAENRASVDTKLFELYKFAPTTAQVHPELRVCAELRIPIKQ